MRKKIDNCYLLHSMFIQEDRSILERQIKDFVDDEKAWGVLEYGLPHK